MKHTKGPWKLNEYKDQVQTGKYSESTLITICNIHSPIPSGPIAETHDTSNYREERSANAKLIAAAPELLEACKEFIACGANAGHNNALVMQVMTAISKAEGES